MTATYSCPDESPKPSVEARSQTQECTVRPGRARTKAGAADVGSRQSRQRVPVVRVVTGREWEGGFSAAGPVLCLDLGAFHIQYMKIQ